MKKKKKRKEHQSIRQSLSSALCVNVCLISARRTQEVCEYVCLRANFHTANRKREDRLLLPSRRLYTHTNSISEVVSLSLLTQALIGSNLPCHSATSSYRLAADELMQCSPAAKGGSNGYTRCDVRTALISLLLLTAN